MTVPAVVRSAAALAGFAAELFRAAGVPSDEADAVAASLVDANLCGHESHGLVRVTEYLELLDRGGLRGGVPLEVLRETPALLVCDGGLGFGQVQMRRLIERLLPKARELGIACGTIRRCGHIGRLGEWVESAARAGCAAWLTVNDNGVLKCVAPPGGTQPVISTNPLALSAPTTGEPIVLDMSTSVVANGKIRVAHVAGQLCPEGWLLDARGLPTRDPATRFGDPPGSILPLGGHKGFGLGLLLDMLAGGLSGGHCPPAPDGTIECNNVVLVVFDPEQFCGRDWLSAEAGRLIESVRTSPRRPGAGPVQLPGDRSAQLRSERRRSGVPLDAGLWTALIDAAGRLGVAIPAAQE